MWQTAPTACQGAPCRCFIAINRTCHSLHRPSWGSGLSQRSHPSWKARSSPPAGSQLSGSRVKDLSFDALIGGIELLSVVAGLGLQLASVLALIWAETVQEEAAISTSASRGADVAFTEHQVSEEQVSQQIPEGGRESQQQQLVASILPGQLSGPDYRPQMLSSGAVCAILIALLCNLLLRWRSSLRNSPEQSRLAGTAAPARLLQLGIVADRQAQALAAAEKQVAKLQMRVQLMAKDLKSPLRQVQKESLQQAEVVAALAKRVEKSELDLKDLQMLMVALQGVSAKQWAVIIQLVQKAKPAAAPLKTAERQKI